MTYSNDIGFDSTLRVYYKGLLVIPSRTASRELVKHGFTTEDCKTILENGYAARKRKKNTEEIWLDLGNKTHNVVIVRVFNKAFDNEVWLITHAGSFTKKRGIMK